MRRPAVPSRRPRSRQACPPLVRHALVAQQQRGGRIVVAALLLVVGCSPDSRTTVPDSVAAVNASSSRPTVPQGTRDTVEAAVARIREHFAAIERDSARHRCVTRDLEGFSAEGGELEACFDGEHLRKLTATYYGESGRATEEYYVWDDRLEFLFARSERYTAPMSGVVAETEEHRTYWLEDRLIRWIGPGRLARPADSPEAATHDRDARNTARRLAACALDPDLTVCTA